MSKPVDKPTTRRWIKKTGIFYSREQASHTDSSEGGLIAQYGPSKLYFENVPLLGRIERYFAHRTATTKIN